MNKKSIYHERLIELADYLDLMDDKMIPEDSEIILFYPLGKDTREPYEVQYFHWIFADMPFLSNDWIFDECDQPVLLDDDCDSTANSVFVYFGIQSPEVFRNLFSPYSQLNKYNGLLLSNKPRPSDIAKNIGKFLESQVVVTRE